MKMKDVNENKQQFIRIISKNSNWNLKEEKLPIISSPR